MKTLIFAVLVVAALATGVAACHSPAPKDWTKDVFNPPGGE